MNTSAECNQGKEEGNMISSLLINPRMKLIFLRTKAGKELVTYGMTAASVISGCVSSNPSNSAGATCPIAITRMIILLCFQVLTGRINLDVTKLDISGSGMCDFE